MYSDLHRLPKKRKKEKNEIKMINDFLHAQTTTFRIREHTNCEEAKHGNIANKLQEHRKKPTDDDEKY